MEPGAQHRNPLAGMYIPRLMLTVSPERRMLLSFLFGLCVYLFTYLFFLVLGMELRASCLLGKGSDLWDIPTAVLSQGYPALPWTPIVDQEDLDFAILLFQPPEELGLQAWPLRQALCQLPCFIPALLLAAIYLMLLFTWADETK